LVVDQHQDLAQGESAPRLTRLAKPGWVRSIVRENLGRPPEQTVIDGSFTIRETILDMDQRRVD